MLVTCRFVLAGGRADDCPGQRQRHHADRRPPRPPGPDLLVNNRDRPDGMTNPAWHKDAAEAKALIQRFPPTQRLPPRSRQPRHPRPDHEQATPAAPLPSAVPTLAAVFATALEPCCCPGNCRPDSVASLLSS
jgi:hypothetical protein